MQQEAAYGAAEIEFDEELRRANSKFFGTAAARDGPNRGFEVTIVVNNISGPGMLDFQAFRRGLAALCFMHPGRRGRVRGGRLRSYRCPRFLEKGKGHARDEPDVANEGGPVARAVLERSTIR